MHNFVAKLIEILEICKQFAENHVNEKGNVVRCGVVPKFSDIEVIALSITAEAFGIDSDNYLFNCLNNEFPNALPNSRAVSASCPFLRTKSNAFATISSFVNNAFRGI